MAVAMAALKRAKSGRWASRQAIPPDVRQAYGKWEEKKTWPATLTPEQAQGEWFAWQTAIKDRIRLLRAAQTSQPVSLTSRECHALAADWYRSKVEAEEATFTDSPTPWDWDVELEAVLPDIDDPGAPLRPTPAIIEARDNLLRDKGIRVDDPSADRLLQAMLTRWVDFLRLMQRRVEGDFGPDPVLETLPPPSGSLSGAARRAKVSITVLFEDFAASGAAEAHTVRKWRAAIQSFVGHLGHDDASAVSRADVSKWLASLVARGLSVKTVRGTYRAAVARVFKLAHSNGQLADNPVDRVEVIGPKPKQTKRKDLSDFEAEMILRAATGPQPEGLSAPHALARRWVPWICAYTGARVGEITQLRAGDIRQEDGVWVFHITPEAGSVKTARARSVPVHSHLIEQGVLKLARAGDPSPLFYDPEAKRKAAAVQSQAKQLGSKLAKWVRELGVTEVQSPNHGWRHRWKSLARRHGVDPEARDVIPGHAPGKEGSRYGDGGYPLAALKDEIEKLPRYGPFSE